VNFFEKMTRFSKNFQGAGRVLGDFLEINGKNTHVFS